MKVELPLGDVIDKISILQIKSERIFDTNKLQNVHKELKILRDAWQETKHPKIEELSEWEGLLEVNGKLWNVEDDLRELEAKQDFGERFISKARSVYFLNDNRAQLKKSINIRLGSTLVEEKSYKDYGSGEGNL
jgi:hypothetical protein